MAVTTGPAPSATETLANAAFDALLWALSRPGLPRRLPKPGEATIVEALLDRECRAFAADPLVIPLILRAGAEIAPIEQAHYAFLGTLSDLAPLAALDPGSDLYPDDAASAVIRVQLGTGPKVRLTGPGVDGAVDLQIGGLPQGFWPRRAALTRYPMGIDIFLLDGDQIVGLPRSTRVEEL